MSGESLKAVQDGRLANDRRPPGTPVAAQASPDQPIYSCDSGNPAVRYAPS
jgi:hypothetical protein